MPGVRALRTYERAWLSRDMIAGDRPRHSARPAGDGLRGAGGTARDHRALHDRHLPRRVCPRGAVADPGPGPGLVAGPDDRGDDPAARRRQPGDGDRPGRDARAPGGARHRGRGRSSSSGSSPTCFRARSGPATSPASRSSSSSASCPSCSDSRPTPTVSRRRCVAFVQSLDQTNSWALGIGLLSLGDHPRPQARCCAADAGHPHRRRRGDRALGRARPRRPAASRDRDPAPGLPAADLPGRTDRGHPAAARRRGGDLARRHRRHDLRLRRLRGSRRLRGGRQPGAGRDRHGQPGGRPVLGLPGEHQRLADGGRVPVRGEDPADRPRRGGASCS